MIALYLALAFALGGLVSAWLLVLFVLRDSVTHKAGQTRAQESRGPAR